MPRWSEPPTWQSDDYVTAAQFNLISKNLEHLKDRERVHCFNSQDEELKDSKWELLRWDSDNHDNNSMHSNHRIGRNFGANLDPKYGSRDGNWPATSERKSGRVVINIGGCYMVILKVVFAANTTGNRKIQIRKNSNEAIGGGHSLGIWTEDATSSGVTGLHLSRTEMLERGDHLNAFAYQSSGDKLDVNSGAAVTFFQVFQLSA